MSTKDTAVRGMVGRSEDLRVVCPAEWLHKCILVVLMFDGVVSKACKDCFIESLSLAVRLWMIRCLFQLFNIKEGAHGSKNLLAN